MEKENIGKKNSPVGIITKTFLNLLSQFEGERIPTQREIATQSGLSLRTVERYFKKMDIAPDMSGENPFKIFTPIVFSNLLLQTKKSPQAAKLWFQLVHGWSENPEFRTKPEQEDKIEEMLSAISSEKTDEIIKILAD